MNDIIERLTQQELSVATRHITDGVNKALAHLKMTSTSRDELLAMYMDGVTPDSFYKAAESIVEGKIRAMEVQGCAMPKEVNDDIDTLITKCGDSKNDLETLGKEFGIDLKKNKSFDNMVKDLKEHLAL